MSIVFKYKKIDRPEPLEPIYAPAIPVTLAAKESLDVIALLDSGADMTAMPKGIAEIIGADLSGKKDDVIGIGGKVSAIESKIRCSVKGAHEKYSFALRVKVLLDDVGGKFPILLGRKDFFENFDVTFKEKNKKIVLKKV